MVEKDFNFISLAAITANVVRWLELSEHHQECREEERQRDSEADHKAPGGELTHSLPPLKD